MKRKGFTLVELLVVIAIIALLMGILMPALSRVRQLAFRMVCGTNLSGIGKAMLIYANDYEDELPRAGGRNCTWGPVKDWMAPNRNAAFGVTGTGGGKATVNSCFYLLVKYTEVTPKSFVCKGDAGTTEFKLADVTGVTIGPGTELIDLWDFGPALADSCKACSYSYHAPFSAYALTTSSEPGFAVAADRNPWIESPGAKAKTWPGTRTERFAPEIQGHGGSNDLARNGNAIVHQNEGQNVLFLDSHVTFEKRPYCSVEEDNIYTVSERAQQGSAYGAGQPVMASEPLVRKDSLLLHDDPSNKVKRTCFTGATLTWVDGLLVPICQAGAGRMAGMLPGEGRSAAGGRQQIERVDVHEGTFDQAWTLVLANGESLCVVGSHFFLLDSGRWVSVAELRAGSVLRTHGMPMQVLLVIPHRGPYVGTVYNLKVPDSHQYLVGRAAVVVRDY